jgi:hypothetical protein
LATWCRPSAQEVAAKMRRWLDAELDSIVVMQLDLELGDATSGSSPVT